MKYLVNRRKLASDARMLIIGNLLDDKNKPGVERLMIFSTDDIALLKVVDVPLPKAGQTIEVVENVNPDTGVVSDTWVSLDLG